MARTLVTERASRDKDLRQEQICGRQKEGHCDWSTADMGKWQKKTTKRRAENRSWGFLKVKVKILILFQILWDVLGEF